MAKSCNNYAIPMRGTKRQDKNINISAWISRQLDSCFKSSTEKPVVLEAETYNFNKFDRPVDMFNCESNLCQNTGTLNLLKGEATGLGATFQFPFPPSELYTGVVTFYITVKKKPSIKFDVIVSDFDDTTQTNADVYTKEVIMNETSNEYVTIPMVVDFSTLPTSVKGTGWAEGTRGFVVGIAMQTATVEELGISSFSFYDSIEELEVNDTVLFSCVDSFSNDISFDTTDAGCLGGSYDKDALSFEKTITVRKATANEYKLNPLASQGENVEGYFPATVKRKIEAITIGGNTYGFVQLGDIYDGVCGLDLVHVGGCNASDGLMKRVENWYDVRLSEDQYTRLPNGVNESDKGMFLFPEALIGDEATIYYPKTEENVLHIVGNDSDMDERNVRLYIPVKYSDGSEALMIFNNVIITGINGGGFSSTEETVKEYTFLAERDAKGNFYEMFIKQ